MKKGLIALGSLAALLLVGGACAPKPALGLAETGIAPPVPAVPYYHIRAAVRLEDPGPFEVKNVAVNGRPSHHYEIRELGGRPLAEAEPYLFTWPLFAAEQIKKFPFRDPWIFVRLDWRNGEVYELEVEIQREGASSPMTLRAMARAPEKGGYWDERWKYYKSIVVSEAFGLDRTDEPVEFSMIVYPDQITDLARELRLVRLDEDGRATLIPSQVYGQRSHLSEDPERVGADGLVRPAYWLPSVYAKVVAPISVKANRSAVLLAFYGNPDAEAQEADGALRVSGEGLGLTVENGIYSVKLHPQSGMLDEIRIHAHPEVTLLHKLETNGAIHWNPDAYSPPRPWMHASDWDPPETASKIMGPVMFALHRKGMMPGMPEIALSITYKFFAHSPYFLMTSNMEILEDVPLQALRNAEIVLDHKLIDSAAWLDPAAARPHEITLDSVPLLTETHMPLDTRWMAFYHAGTRIAFGGIPLEAGEAGMDIEPLTYNPNLYFIRGPWVYWTRVIAAPYLTHNIQQIVPVPAGNSYWEKWAYLPFVISAGPDRFRALSDLEERLAKPLRISVVDEKDPRVRIPDEIYTDPTKTGWEERK